MSASHNYRRLTTALAPLIYLWLYGRRLKGKEDSKRFRERLGFASRPRPEGALFWLHAASVGEAMSVLLLIQKLRVRFPQLSILLTTGTVTSAKLMQSRLPQSVIHQYAPVDTPQATQRFMRHWHPDFAFWVESEFWPNLIYAADARQAFTGVINARMSERSFHLWRRFPGFIGDMLKRFDLVFAQSDEDAKRLTALGARKAQSLGNLKYDAALLPCDEVELVQLKKAIGARRLWLAASTHPGEEVTVAEAHSMLSKTVPNLLTIIVPRHPRRGDEIAAGLRKFGKVAQRAKKEAITPQTQFYIADTLGELGLFYRLSDIVLMGGSLIEHGGQNPLEPARLSCAIITGLHTHNFAEIYLEMERFGGCLWARDARTLAAQVQLLLTNPATLESMQKNLRRWVESKSGTADRVLSMLTPLLEARKEAA